MKQRSLFIFCAILACAAGVSAQRTITNGTLQKYADQRLSAEREYRETYEKKGMPSPEQLDRWRDQDRQATEQLAARLHAENLQQEMLQTQIMIAENNAAAMRRNLAGYAPAYYDPNIYGYGYGGSAFGRGRGFGFRSFQPQGYFAGGQFWPSPGAVRIAPTIRIGGGRGHFGGRR